MDLFSQAPGRSWSHAFGGVNYDPGSGIVMDNSGNVVTCGYYYADTIFVGNRTLLDYGATDSCIAKYDPAGNLIRAKRMEFIS